jgi:hypothetical protein
MSVKPEGMAESEAQEIRRQSIQAILLHNQNALLPNSVEFIPSGRFVFNYRGSPTDIPNKLVNPADTKDFFHASNHQLSLLQPKLEFYIGGVKSPSSKPVIFSDYVSSQKMVDFAALRGEGSLASITEPSNQLGVNVGVKSFSWNFDNKHQGDRVVKASLSLYFGSMVELLNETYLDFLSVNLDDPPADLVGTPDEESKAGKKDALKKRIEARTQSLKKGELPDSAKPESESLKRNFKVLKVLVGWAIPDNADTKLLTDSFISGVEASRKTLILNLTSYGINFGENGTVELSIEYVASIDAEMLSQRTDVLRGDASVPKIKDREVAIARAEHFWRVTKADRDDTLWPGGYIKAQYDQAAARNWPDETYDPEHDNPTNEVTAGAMLNGLGFIFSKGSGGTTRFDKAFRCRLEGIRAEVELLHDKIELLLLVGSSGKSGPTGTPTPQPESDDLQTLRKWLSAAEEVYEEGLRKSRGVRYQAFMEGLIRKRKIFIAAVRLESLRRTASVTGDAQSRITRTQAIVSVSKNLSTADAALVSQKLMQTAWADVARGQSDISEWLEKTHTLDPLSQSAAEHEEGRDIVNTYYIRLADLIEVAMENAGMSALDHNIILGSYSPGLLGYKGFSPTSTLALPIGDIPISLAHFSQWFLENVVTQERNTWSLRRFLDSLFNGLVSPMMNYAENKSPKSHAAFGFTSLSLPLRSNKLVREGTGRSARDSRKSSFMVGLRSFDLFRKALKLPAVKHINGNYIIVFSKQVANLDGNREKDEEKGIYHLFVGADTGIAKRFAFKEKAMPQIRAMNIESANHNKNKAGVLVIPQDCSVGLIGNTAFINGSLVYINAEMGLGRNAAKVLKLGGYYRVYKSSHSIEPGTFQTTIDCIHQFSPVPTKV